MIKRYRLKQCYSCLCRLFLDLLTMYRGHNPLIRPNLDVTSCPLFFRKEFDMYDPFWIYESILDEEYKERFTDERITNTDKQGTGTKDLRSNKRDDKQ